MTGAAQLDFHPGDRANFPLPAAEPGSDLRRQAAARLAAHRQRRGTTAAEAESSRASGASQRSSIAATVAERYAQTPSYRAFLADHAKRSMEEAAAAAEVALRNAEAVVAAQQQLLGELELWNAPQEFTPETSRVQTNRVQTAASQSDSSQTTLAPSSPVSSESKPPAAVPTTGVGSPLTVRLYEELASAPIVPVQVSGAALDSEETHALDEEIAFRQSPVFEDYKAYLQREAEPPIPLPANLLEFPRQLVAPRKARPRLAEGPLRDDSVPVVRQLRIFEVEAGQISASPALPSATPEWASIHLDAPTLPDDFDPVPASPQLPSLLPPHAAALGLRSMALLFDAGLVLAALVVFAGIFAKVAGQVPGGWAGLAALAVAALVLHVCYGLFFFSFGDQTPGMRYARIGFCTFSDENPSRGALRKRVLIQLLAMAPFGMGLLWALLDEDGLGWHDRLSRMYLRAY